MSLFLVLPHLKIQNANALSSPFTVGFPAMTAWLGAVHALQRRLNQRDYDELRFVAVGVISHCLDLQTYRGKTDFHSSIVSTGNPLDKEGKRPAFIEEARCHLEVSLVLKLEGFGQFDDERGLFSALKNLLPMMKFASGDLIDFSEPRLESDDDEKSQRKLLRRLMPGYALIERRDLMVDAMNNGQDALDALLDGVSIKHRSEIDDKGNISWTSERAHKFGTPSGWIVPIATGFHGITDLARPGETSNQRDTSIPHRFAESVVTLGEFVMSYRLDRIEKLLWRYIYEPSSNLYVCRNWQPKMTENVN